MVLIRGSNSTTRTVDGNVTESLARMMSVSASAVPSFQVGIGGRSQSVLLT
jgi:hypothetical protein